MNRTDYLAQYPWIDPERAEGVRKIDGGKHIAVSIGSTHKSIEFMEPILSNDLERVADLDWELFTASHTDTPIRRNARYRLAVLRPRSSSVSRSIQPLQYSSPLP